jgi:hypothetical protein
VRVFADVPTWLGDGGSLRQLRLRLWVFDLYDRLNVYGRSNGRLSGRLERLCRVFWSLTFVQRLVRLDYQSLRQRYRGWSRRGGRTEVAIRRQWGPARCLLVQRI